MKVGGFSFIKNAVKYGFPIEEAIKSILPICDKFYIAVGDSEDQTRYLIEKIDPEKVVIIDTVWDKSLTEGGRVLAAETNKAFQAIPNDFDWAFYIQGDEVMHEQYLSTVQKAMLKWKDAENVDGLLFKYLHFYGSYDYVGNSEKWYPHEIRIIKNNKKIYSYRDAQGFRKNDNQKLNVKSIDAYMYHYGWVKDPRTQSEKRVNFEKLFNKESTEKTIAAIPTEFDYSGIDSLALFKGTHPKVMQDLINRRNWTFNHNLTKNKSTLKNSLKKLVKMISGVEIGYKNYKII